ncbi:MAG: MarR family winged helix-turn-helix transcriptional regulator [Comamonas sp.]|jgi:DNA-binding MarR family transcriptional regulator|nr:MarR family winged helix-turn-helix transcriptional regulator [Comamonas sp.]MCD6662536.1 MarR family winged helix-turn-helix transcriptional regulator [Comamonas sp.]
MPERTKPGLGELLRHVTELVDLGAEERYRDLSPGYRARYTPVLRAMEAAAATVTDITDATHLTQGAVSQTIALMIAEGIVVKRPMEDARKSSLRLSPKGRALLKKLQPNWDVTFKAIDALETEIGHPLRQVLVATAKALEREGFAQRLRRAALETTRKEASHDR